MTATALTRYRTRPDEEAVREVTAPAVVSLDDIMESSSCSCAASDDNPN
jgi:hypothetical protein